MEQLPIDLDELISQIDTEDLGPLQLVTDAVIVSGRLADLADQVVDHFVQQARAHGASWAEIGQSMGVSKQAAQKRFVEEKRSGFKLTGGGLFTRFDSEARATVQAAVAYAHKLKSAEINTLHVVMALAAGGSGPAHRVINDLSGSAEQVAGDAADSIEGPERPRKVKHLPFSNDAKKLLELSLREAVRAKSRHIGTEHILLAVLRDRRTAGAKVLEDNSVTHAAVERWLDENPINDR